MIRLVFGRPEKVFRKAAEGANYKRPVEGFESFFKKPIKYKRYMKTDRGPSERLLFMEIVR